MPSPEYEKVHPQIPGICHKPASGTDLEGVAGAVFDLSAVRRIRFLEKGNGSDGSKRGGRKGNVSVK